MTNVRIESRRAIEALRSGVPNQDAVKALGGTQPALEDRFKLRLDEARNGIATGKQSTGMLLAGGFGSGKSHLLERFQHVALEANFVCSKIVISKETPLYDPAKVYRAAIESATIPGRRGAALPEIAAGLNFDSTGYAELVKWANHPDVPINSRFAATLYVYENAKADDEIRDRILGFWAGGLISIAELRKCLRETGEAATYKIDKAPAREMALQRYRFLPRLAIAAGYSGWVLLVDEVEIIGRYSIRQRAKSYAEVARWMGMLEGFVVPGLISVLSIADDFESVVLVDRHDEEKIPNKLEAIGDQLAASQAERGMQIIRKEKTILEGPSAGAIRETFQKLRSIYGSAYGWEPPASYMEPDRTARIRQNVKRWITEWDLMRLYPTYKPTIEVVELSPSYVEEHELEVPSEGSDGDADSSK